MNIGTIVTPNTKGQIVIPKKIRDDLIITEDTPLNIRIMDDGIYIHPITEVVTNAEEDKRHQVLMRILKETQGTWANDKEFNKRQKRMRKMEIAAAKKMRKTW